MNLQLLRPIIYPRFWLGTLKLMLKQYEISYGAVPKLGKNDDAVVDVTASIRFPHQVFLGNKVTIGERCSLWASEHSKIIIGENTILGPNVVIVSMNHGIVKDQIVREQSFIEEDIVIGPDCWLGSNCIILSGVTLGQGTVVAAGAVVTKDTPSFSIVGGVPAKVISERK